MSEIQVDADLIMDEEGANEPPIFAPYQRDSVADKAAGIALGYQTEFLGGDSGF